MVEAPGTAPGSATLISQAVYRHSRLPDNAKIGRQSGRDNPGGRAALDEEERCGSHPSSRRRVIIAHTRKSTVSGWPQTTLSPRRSTAKQPGALDSLSADAWLTASVDPHALARMGIKAQGGGPHQSKTMMLVELTDLLTAEAADRAEDAVVRDNLLGKPSVRARKAALYRLRQLYGVGDNQPICIVLRRLWERDPAGRPMLALLCALARDPAFRAGASAVLGAPLGERVRWPAIAAAFEAQHPGRLGEKMLKSLAQNAASSWTQAGFLRGSVRKERIRAHATPACAAYAALIASVCGFGGMRLIESRWLDALDRPVEDRLALLRQAEGLGLARVRTVGDVMEIDIRGPLGRTLGVPKLVER